MDLIIHPIFFWTKSLLQLIMKSNLKKIVVIGSGFGGIAAALRLKAKNYTVTLVEKLTLLEGILGENGFSVGSKLSLSDVVLFAFITQFFDNKEASYNATLATPRLKAIVDSVQTNEKVIEWLEKRPKTVF